MLLDKFDRNVSTTFEISKKMDYLFVDTMYIVTQRHLICYINTPLSLSLSLSPFKRPFSRWTWISRYQNVSILDFIGAKDDGIGGDNWSYKMCETPVKSTPPTYQHPFFTGRMPFLSPNKQRQSTEGNTSTLHCAANFLHSFPLDTLSTMSSQLMSV